MGINKTTTFKYILTTTLILYFSRTMFLGYKYLLLMAIIPAVIVFVMQFAKKRYISVAPNIIFPLIIYACFALHFTTNKLYVKELINATLITGALFFFNKEHVTTTTSILKHSAIFIEFAGCIAILKLLLTTFSVHIPYYNRLFEGNYFSLVRDNNFYSLFFIILIVISLFLLHKKEISITHFVFQHTIALANIILSYSRRALLLWVVLSTTLFVVYMFKREYHKTIVTYVKYISSLTLICLLALIPCKQPILEHISNDSNKLIHLYKIVLLAKPHLTFHSFEKEYKNKVKENMVWPSKDEDNLFYNADFSYRLKYWDVIDADTHKSTLSLKKSKDGPRSVILKRDKGYGYWQLHYSGRPIFYHKGCTYTFSFKYRNPGTGSCQFCVGWWADDGYGHINDLRKTVTPCENDWYMCEASYTFLHDQINPVCLINSMPAGSSVEIKDIKLHCNDTTGLPMFVDQMPDSIIFPYATKLTVPENKLTVSRTDRWAYAWQLWQTQYDWKQKIIGHGFDYLEWYGLKYHNNPQRYDFPHNPIISAFLYSGIIGGIIYIIFIFMSLLLYWNKRESLGIYLILYLCCMFFCMFSGSSHFSFPLFTFLSFLPFIANNKKTSDANTSSN